MKDRLWRIFDWAIPTVLAAAVVYWPQWTDSLKDRGGWYAVGGTVLMIAGRAFYQWWNERKA